MSPSPFMLILMAAGTATSLGLPALATTLPSDQPTQAVEVAGLFHVIDVAEDVDDFIDGDFGQIDPIREVTEDVVDAMDDVNDTIYDVTHINIIEPFVEIDDTVENFADDVDDTLRHVSNDVNDWFD